MDIHSLTVYDLLQKRKRLRRELMESAANARELRIAVLGGTTTNELVDLLELLLLQDGFRPVFYQSEYNKFYEDAVMDSEALRAFRPEIVYVHTHVVNVQQFPKPGCPKEDHEAMLAAEAARFRSIWFSIGQEFGCHIVQNNFELPPYRLLGNLDAIACGGRTRFISELNLQLARAAAENPKLLIHDIHALSAQMGLDRWFDWSRWFSYKILTTPEASFAVAKSLAAMIGSMLGRARKCLVLDLDNTLWGGVIGDDGVDKIQIGKETAVAEAYTAFQQYCLELRERGIVLAVASKNELEIAQSGFAHPDSILKLEHFAAFKANWQPKHESLTAIAEELNLGLDSFVFVDDNPAEREIVRSQLPQVSVPEVGNDPSQFIQVLDGLHLFETAALSAEDFARAERYAANASRAQMEARFSNYGEYLQSLEMTGEIEPFKPVYLERVAQLINKTNQFNLTTRRYTFAEVEAVANSSEYLTLYGKLTDRFGEHGLISVIIARLEGRAAHVDLWIMSCRVLKRDMEQAMLDELVERARAAGVRELVGTYLRTAKNAMVADHYQKLGFELVEATEDGSRSEWRLDVSCYEPRNRHIHIRELVHG